MKPPVAKKIPRVETRHGRQVQDDYHWLRQRSDPAVVDYLEAENAYTDAMMQPTEALQEKLYREILGRIKQTDRSVPERIGDHYYYERTKEGRQYPVHCRTCGSPDAEEEVLLDENEWARDRDHFRLDVFEVSPDHGLLAFSVDLDGSENYTLRFKDLRSGQLLQDEIRGTYTSVEWAADSRTVFYNTIDAAHRPYRLYRHVLGDNPARDVLVYEERDEAFFLGLYKTKSKRYLMLHVDSNTSSEVRFLDAADPRGEFEIVQPRRRDVEYTVEHHDRRFLILTNEDAVNFKLMEAPAGDPSRGSWQEVIPHCPDVKLDEVQPFAGHLAVAQRKAGLQGIRIIRLADGAEHAVVFAEPVYTVRLQTNPEFDTDVVRFGYSSPITPDSVFDYHMPSRAKTLLKEKPVLGGYDRNAYHSARVHATAPDGTRVPISLVYRKQLRRNGPNPLLLYGYGSYGISIDPGFDSGRVSLLDRGFVYAIAHVRGGGELGRPWYEAGKLLHKTNTFTDFIACAEHLIDSGYTTKDRLVIQGRSAGGLLVGAVTNMRPDLFRVAVTEVPFVDVVNTMLDTTIPLTIIEYEEWGDPRRQGDFDYMMSYSPYDNVRAASYGDMLVMAGLNDPRVAYWEPAKWTAKLRAVKLDGSLLLLKTDMQTGHGGPSGRYDRIRELAFEYAFILDRLGSSLGLRQ